MKIYIEVLQSDDEIPSFRQGHFALSLSEATKRFIHFEPVSYRVIREEKISGTNSHRVLIQPIGAIIKNHEIYFTENPSDTLKPFWVQVKNPENIKFLR